MKLTYKAQIIISIIVIILANVLTDVLDHWIYRSIGWGICGLLFVINPVTPNGMDADRKAVFWTRVAGVILILIGVFTRVHY